MVLGQLHKGQLCQAGNFTQDNFVDFLTGVKRPIEVIQTPQGTLLVADFETGHIFEISYAGN